MSQLSKDIERISLPASTELSFVDPALSGGSRAAPARGPPASGPVPNTFFVTFSPHEYLWIDEPVTFEFRVPMSYAAMPPAVSCKDEGFVAKHGPKVEIDESGQVTLNILKLGTCSWMRGYTISDVIHCLHQKLQLPDLPQVKIITPMSTPTSGVAGRLKKADSSSALGASSPAVPLASGEFGLQGKRPTMEDQTVCIDRLMLSDGKSVGFYAVYDGHGGAAASKFASERVHEQFCDNVKAGLDLRKALYTAFRATDAQFEAENKSEDMLSQGELSGTTAAVVVIDGSRILAGNVGDSRAVMSRDGSAVALTEDHKANRPDEIARIVNAGGFVVHNRVMGRLAVSRAIGDIAFKTGTNGAQMVTGAPELFETSLCEKDEMIIIGCDGLFDVMSSQQVITFARSAMSDGAPPAEVAKQLALEALKLGSNDNISVVCVKIGDGVPKGSIRRGPAVLAMMEGSMSGGGPSPTAAAASATNKLAAPAAGGSSGLPPSTASRKIYSSNPFSKSYTPSEAGSGFARRPTGSSTPSSGAPSAASGEGGVPRRSSTGAQVESMVSAMRLSDADFTEDDTHSMKLPPSAYQTPPLTALSAPSSASLASSGSSDGTSSPSYFSVPGIPTFNAPVLTAPSFGSSPKSSRGSELSKQEEEDLMDSILQDTES